MKKTINSAKQVETFLFCEKIKQQSKEFDDRFDDLISKEEINELSKDFKQLNLEDDEDISHHISVLNKYKDIYRNDEENRYTN